MIWNFRRHENNIALISENEIIDYKRLKICSDEICHNIQKRSLVFLLCSNTYESIAGYVGFLNHGIVPVMIDGNLDRELLSRLVDVYRPKYFWLPDSMSEFFNNCEKICSLDSYVLLKSKEESAFPLYDELALLMTTSGSTGSPKLVRLSYKNIKANTESIIKYLKIDEKERSITNLPMHYVYGLSIINTHLYAGASVVVTEKSMFQKEFWQIVREQEVTNFGGVPYTFEMLNRLRFFKMELPLLQTITQAGGKLSLELHKKFAEYASREGKKFVVMYGAAEATARMGYLPSEQSLRKCGAMGIPIPGGRFSLMDEGGKEIKLPNKMGELIYHGENVMLGYAECGEDLSKGDEEQGTLHTGDLAKFDEDGYYTVLGRKKRFLKIYGKRINLQEVEFILQKHFNTLGIAVSGKDDQMNVFLERGSLAEEVKEYIVDKFKVHHLALRICCVDSIPKNSSGKILYSKLEAMV